VGVAAFVLWLFVGLAAFYAVQKPFTPDTAGAVMRSALDPATAALLTVLGATLGRRILNWVGLDDLDASDLAWLASGLGLGALALLNLGLGMVGAGTHCLSTARSPWSPCR
jgi:hypothetical protein